MEALLRRGRLTAGPPDPKGASLVQQSSSGGCCFLACGDVMRKVLICCLLLVSNPIQEPKVPLVIASAGVLLQQRVDVGWYTTQEVPK